VSIRAPFDAYVFTDFDDRFVMHVPRGWRLLPTRRYKRSTSPDVETKTIERAS
jgi:hypothetical protein